MSSRWAYRGFCSVKSNYLPAQTISRNVKHSIQKTHTPLPSYLPIRALMKELKNGIRETPAAVITRGWIRFRRKQKKQIFLNINDGTSLHGIQVVLERKIGAADLTVGASVEVVGNILPNPNPKGIDLGHPYEIHGDEIKVIGICNSNQYPIQPKYHSPEYLREVAHLRCRTSFMSAVMRLRNQVTMDIHKFLQGEDFIQIHTPIISPMDCEGAGEMFQVIGPNETVTDKKSGQTEQNPSKTFFGKPAYLGVSGQLYAEMCAAAIARVYTFGPTFRAENSQTSRHLCEFWMLEPEIAFTNLHGIMDICERLIKSIIRGILSTCQPELIFFNQRDKNQDVDIIKRLEDTLERKFNCVSYTDAIQILLDSGVEFKYPPCWGSSLQSEHERYLSDVFYKGPVFVTHYPRSFKPFYMRASEKNIHTHKQGNIETVACMDLLLPGIGEVAGGSEREERFKQLKKNIKASRLKPRDYKWYLELRKYGSVPHAGFGLGFERLLSYISGVHNVRDLILIPRAPHYLPF